MADEPTTEATETAAAPAAETGPEVAEAELPEAPPTAATGTPGPLDVLLDVKMPVEVRLGSVEASVRELLQLGPGSVLKLDKPVGEPVDLHLGGVPFARARIVVVGDRLGVRVEQILSPGADPPSAGGG